MLLEDPAGALKKRPISAITRAAILIVLQKIENTGLRETARRLRGVIGNVSRMAVATFRAKDDPTYAFWISSGENRSHRMLH